MLLRSFSTGIMMIIKACKYMGCLYGFIYLHNYMVLYTYITINNLKQIVIQGNKT